MYISRFGSGPQLDCVHVQISLLSEEVSRSVDIRTEDRRVKIEGSRNGKSAFKHNQGVYTNVHIIIYLILNYDFSEFNLHVLFYFCFIPKHHVIY